MYMIAFVKISIKDGISKKLLSQASAISKIKGYCTLLCLSEDSKFQKIEYKKGVMADHQIGDSIKIDFASLGRVDPFIRAVEMEVRTSTADLYIRHMVPSRYYLKFLKNNSEKTIYYEIPTYPYYYEQFKASNNVLLTSIRLCYEAIYWPAIYKAITKIVAIPCRSNAHKFKKMVYVTNGYSSLGKYVGRNDRRKESLTMIGVGTIQRYHGYEKIIELMRTSSDPNVKFIIVGDGEVEYLKELTAKYNLEESVVFTGAKCGDELERLYKEADIGIGTMALEQRKADIDTGIKILDYYIHGIPVISSGMCPEVYGLIKKPYMIYHPGINTVDIKDFSDNFNEENRYSLTKITRKEYSWDSIMGRIINE